MTVELLKRPDMKSVESSNITSIGHDADNSFLYIQFKNGSVYRYACVTTGMYQDMLNAESVGRYHAQVVKKLPYEKVA